MSALPNSTVSPSTYQPSTAKEITNLDIGVSTQRRHKKATQLAADAESSGGLVKISFQRIVRWPDGRKEIEEVTPKQLAPPAPDPALPRPTDPTDDTNEGAAR